MDQRHGLTERAAERLCSILSSSALLSRAGLSGAEVSGHPDATGGLASAAHAAASFAASHAAAAHAAAALVGATAADLSSSGPEQPRSLTASPSGGARLGPEWERLTAAAFAAAALTQPAAVAPMPPLRVPPVSSEGVLQLLAAPKRPGVAPPACAPATKPTTAAAAAAMAAAAAGPVWRFALGGRSDGAPNYVSRLRIFSSGLLPTVTLPLREAPNGQQFGETHGNFTYLVPPVLAAVRPASGPAFGGTGLLISGANLDGGDDYRCRFLTWKRQPHASAAAGVVAAAATVGAAFDAAVGSVRCTTPTLLLTSSANVTVTLNGQQYAAAKLVYAVVGDFTDAEGVWRFGPFGAGHVENCSFTYGNFTEAEPKCARRGVLGMRVRPTVGPTDGNTTVQFIGVNFAGGDDYRCRFSLGGSGTEHEEVPARLSPVASLRVLQHHLVEDAGLPLEPWLLDAGRVVLTCLTPSRAQRGFVAGGLSLVEVTINGQQYFGSNNTFFRYHQPPQLASILKSSGARGGGTAVNITFGNETRAISGGGGAREYELATCCFGKQTVPATRSASEAALRCVSPPEQEAGAILATIVEFALGVEERAQGREVPLFAVGESLPQHLNLSGSAQLEIEGEVSVLQLTAAAPWHSRADAGSAELGLGGSTGPWLSVAILVRTRGGSSASGLSLSYGDFPPEEASRSLGLGEWGAGGGLRISLMLTRREGSPSALPPLVSQWLHVRFGGVDVLSPVAIYPPLEGDAPFWVQIRYDLSGLHIALDGRGYVDGAAVAGWQPQPHWRFGVGAFNGEAESASVFVGVDEYSVHGLTVARGSAVWPAEQRVRVSLNGQQLTVDSLGFMRVGSPALHGTSPSSGPIGGGTRVLITGVSLSGGDDYRCRFGHSVVPATYSTASADAPWLPISMTHPGSQIRCTSPDAMEAGRVVLQVSPNAQQYAGTLAYTYYGDVAMLELSPSSGPELGGTHVMVSGRELELGSHYVCRFNETVVPARLVPSSLAQYVAFTGRHVGSAVTAVHRMLGTRAEECLAYDSDDVHELDRVSAAVAACHASPSCEAVYYNECDETPHRLLLCPVDVSFAEAALAAGCSFRKIESFDKVSGAHCLGEHYGHFSSVRDAVLACSLDPECGAVYDQQCDGSGADVYLCPKRESYQYEREGFEYATPLHAASGRGSCLYFRPPTRMNMDCTSPAAASFGGLVPYAGLAPVHVALNAQQFVGNASANAMHSVGLHSPTSEGFTYYLHSVVSEVSPTSGPRAGGTLVNVSGVGFADGSHYTCAFGAHVVPASFAAGLGGTAVISCVSPAGAESGTPVALEVALNAQQYTVEAHGFRYHGLPVVSGFSPSSGPAAGATRVVVSGGAFGGGSDYRCRWGGCGSCSTEWSCGACVVNGTFGEGEGGEQTVTCESPSLEGVEAGASAAAVLLEVSLNSQEYTASNASELVYQYYAPPVLAGVSPALGPHEGATALRLSGSALTGAGSHLKCRFNRSETAATVDAGSAELRCASASSSSSVGNATLQVSLNGQQFEASVVQYGYYEQVEVVSLNGLTSGGSGPTLGGTTVVVGGLRLGIGDTMTPDYRCAFGDTCASCGWSTPTSSTFWGGSYSAGCDCTTVVPATLTHGGTALTCVSPVTPAGSPALEVSLNAQDYSNSSVPVPFVFGDPLDLIALIAQLLAGRRLAQVEDTAAALALQKIFPISPTSGPMLGDTLLTLYLPNFGFGSGD